MTRPGIVLPRTKRHEPRARVGFNISEVQIAKHSRKSEPGFDIGGPKQVKS
jgi:hypothetical protein